MIVSEVFFAKRLCEKTKKGTICKRKGLSSRNNPLIRTFDPNFQPDIQAGIEDADARFNAKKEENEERRIQRENAKVPVTVTWSMRSKKRAPNGCLGYMSGMKYYPVMWDFEKNKSW